MFCKTSFFRVTAALGLALAAGVCPVSGADVKTLHGHVPAIVSKLAALGELPATNELRLALGLPLRNQARTQALWSGDQPLALPLARQPRAKRAGRGS